MRYYPAILEKEADSDYGVSFPDFPGCAAAGATPDEALKDAEAALKFHVEGMLLDGEAIPDPSDIEGLAVDRDIEQIAFIMVPLRAASRIVRVNITIDESLLADVDAAAAAQGLTRSGFLAHAAGLAIKPSKRKPTASKRLKVARRPAVVAKRRARGSGA